MENNKKHGEDWKRLAMLMGMAGALILIAAYMVDPDTAKVVMTSLIEETNLSLLSTLHARFSAYAYPYNAMLAVMVSWISSPLTIYAGYIFSNRIIRENIIEHAPKNKLAVIFRALVSIGMGIGILVAVVVLAGVDNIYCRNCEQSSMLFMLSVCWIGFASAGAFFGVASNMRFVISNGTGCPGSKAGSRNARPHSTSVASRRKA